MTPLPDDDPPDRPRGDPTPAQIRKLCEEIQSTWSINEMLARGRGRGLLLNGQPPKKSRKSSSRKS